MVHSYYCFHCRQIAEEKQRRLTQRLQQLAAEQRREDEAKRRADAAAGAEAAVGEKRRLEQNALDGRLDRTRGGEPEVDQAKMLRRRQVPRIAVSTRRAHILALTLATGCAISGAGGHQRRFG